MYFDDVILKGSLNSILYKGEEVLRTHAQEIHQAILMGVFKELKTKISSLNKP